MPMIEMIYNVCCRRTEKGYRALLKHLQESRSQVSEHETSLTGVCSVNLYTNRQNGRRQFTSMTNEQILENAKSHNLKVS